MSYESMEEACGGVGGQVERWLEAQPRLADAEEDRAFGP